jgi:hypothetical protein
MREVRAAPNREMAQIGGSHCGGMATAAFRNAPGTTAILVSEVGGPSQGRTGEKVVCLSTGVKERGEEGNKTAASGFRTRSGSRQRGKEGGRGVRGWEPHGGRERERKRRPGHGGGWLSRPASNPDRRVEALSCDSGGWRHVSMVLTGGRVGGDFG